jgi:D-ribose pyranose/furanose isomerase RbsD
MGTCYDGKLVFNELKKIKSGESISLIEDNKKIWEITKSYGSNIFDDNSSSIGYKIDVFQESINQTISEYLVNFDYLNRIMTTYGFEILTRDEAIDLGLPNGTGLFSELFSNMLEEIVKNKFRAKEYYKAPSMTEPEKKISFLNRYFIYKKVRTVNIENIELELGEYQETAALRSTKQETNEAQKVATEEVKKNKPKVRKLSKKLLLVAATEAIDENIEDENIEDKKESIKKNKKEKQKKSEKILIIESDDEE